MEGQPLLARRLLKQRADGNVRLRDDDNQKVRGGPVSMVDRGGPTHLLTCTLTHNNSRN